MKINWSEYTGKTLHITMQENYGLAFDARMQSPIYEIVFKTGKLLSVFEEGLLLEQQRETENDNENGNNTSEVINVKVFIPYGSIKCVEIFDI